MIRKNYTLMEILVVAAIIAILAGIAIPSVMVAKRYAKESATLAEIQSISTAMKHFETEYGENSYPTPNGVTWEESTALPSGNSAVFFSMLTGFSNRTAITGTAWGNNRKHIKFLNPRPDGGTFNFKDGDYTAEYQIFVDVNGDGVIDLSGVANSPRVSILAKTAIYVKTSRDKNRFVTSWNGIIQQP